MSNIPMKILIIEDDENEWKVYKTIARRRTDIEIVCMTNSSKKGLEEYNLHKPEAIILDLELNNGEGSGFDFIDKIKKIDINSTSKIVVTTNIHSDSVYNFCHDNKIDFIFYKKQQGYSQENVINTLMLLRGYNSTEKVELENFSQKDVDDKIKFLINKELDNIGVSHHLQGRKYFLDAIYFMVKNGDESKVPIVQYLVSEYKKSHSTITRAMQNAIIHAWRVTPLEDLELYYTARINYERGIPTPSELIYYYSDKIKKEI